MDLMGNKEAEPTDNILSGKQNNRTYDENEFKKLSNTQHIESITEEFENCFEINEEWKSSIVESLNETITKIKSKEDYIQSKYKKLLEMKDSLVKKEKELKARIEVIIEILKTSNLHFGGKLSD